MTPQKELLEIFDYEGNYLGLLDRKTCHNNPNIAHKAVHVLVFNSKKELILQKRSSKKELYPNFWDTSVGGHLIPGENYYDAAIRECKEELGFEPRSLTFLYTYKAFFPHETELVTTYYTIFDGPYIFQNSDEVSEIKAFSLDELFATCVNHQLSPYFLLELEQLKKFIKKHGRVI